MKKNVIYGMIDWNAKKSWVIPSVVALIALIVELLILNAEYLDWYVNTQEKADSINRLCESICLGYLSGYFIYMLTVFLPNYIKLYRYKKYVVEDLGDLRNGVYLIINSITDSGTDGTFANISAFYQSIKAARKNGLAFSEESEKIRCTAYTKIGNSLGNLNDKRDLFSIEELEVMYKLKSHLLSIDKTVKSILNDDMEKNDILVFESCKSLYDNYRIISDLYTRTRDKYWGYSITD